MEDTARSALATDRTIDITTTGRTSGRPRRLEIWMHQIDGSLFITGLPGRRSWYANVLADPHMTLHLKQSAQADLPAIARPVVDDEERRTVMAAILGRLDRAAELDRWLVDSPLIEVQLG